MKLNHSIPSKVSLLAGLIIYMTFPTRSLAGYPVTVLESIPITTQVTPVLGTMNASLGDIALTQRQIGTAINQNGSKITTQIEQSAQAQRDQDIFARQTDKLEKARRTYTVPDNICTESGSGMAVQIQSGVRAKQSSLANGSGISNRKIRQSITTPAPPQGQTQFRTASIHADYCDAVDFAAYGGTSLCKNVSELPGGDKRLTSLLDGAGQDGKSPDLTFNQKQTDAAMAYVLNSTLASAGRQLNKGEVKAASGQQYIGLMTQYEAINSAAREPMLAMLAASQPNEATRDVLKETLTTPSAAAYFNRTASNEAQRTGIMSEREFEQFETGRRYANTNYQTDLQDMANDNLMRESIRVQSLQNWLLLGIKQQLQKNNVLQGQLLSLNATEAYRPQLQMKMREVNAGAARND
ncbi:conjugal transfer protein TraW (plasmid) [Xenorhabdus stockiae]|uniref:conjugal transfer protein TraW n=1 Tax=Xenorhabdus stockiae TaxID=351614 RepID=UPI003CF54B31